MDRLAGLIELAPDNEEACRAQLALSIDELRLLTRLTGTGTPNLNWLLEVLEVIESSRCVRKSLGYTGKPGSRSCAIFRGRRIALTYQLCRDDGLSHDKAVTQTADREHASGELVIKRAKEHKDYAIGQIWLAKERAARCAAAAADEQKPFPPPGTGVLHSFAEDS